MNIKYLSAIDSKTFINYINSFIDLVKHGQSDFIYGNHEVEILYVEFFCMLDLVCLAGSNCQPEKDIHDHTTNTLIGELLHDVSNINRAAFDFYMSHIVTKYKYKDDFEERNNIILKIRLYSMIKKLLNSFRIFSENTKLIFGSEFYNLINTDYESYGFYTTKSKLHKHNLHMY